MFVKWESRSRAYSSGRNLEPMGPVRRQRRRSDTQGPHRTLIARLVESSRADGRTRQRIVAHLGTCREPVEVPRHRMWFYRRCDEVLAGLDLSADDRNKIAGQLEARLPRPTAAELKTADDALFRAERAIRAALGRPDGFALLMRDWNTADQSDRQRFIDELRRAGATT